MKVLALVRGGGAMLVCSALLVGCGPADRPEPSPEPAEKPAGDPSIRTLSYPFPPGSKFFVENGKAFDRATVDIGKHTTLVVGEDARVEVRVGASDVELFMEKWMREEGRDNPNSIRDRRKEMGCARKEEGGKLLIATYGWCRHIHGGAGVRLLIQVPAGLRVERRAGLSQPPDGFSVSRHLVDLGPGWHAIPDRPDPDATVMTKE
jgi:hypothetical protein